MLFIFSSFEASICTQKSVTSLEDHFGVPYCDIGHQIGGNWKNEKLCTNHWLSMLFSHVGSPLKALSWLRRWSNLNASDIMIFVAHLIVMGLVKKTNIVKYCSTNSLTRTPFFGKIVKKYLPKYSSEPAHISQ